MFSSHHPQITELAVYLTRKSPVLDIIQVGPTLLCAQNLYQNRFEVWTDHHLKLSIQYAYIWIWMQRTAVRRQFHDQLHRKEQAGVDWKAELCFSRKWKVHAVHFHMHPSHMYFQFYIQVEKTNDRLESVASITMKPTCFMLWHNQL